MPCSAITASSMPAWEFAKALQLLEEAPAIYARAERWIEAADWITWQLTGVETRNACTAGYKAIWSKADGFPSQDYFAALDPRLAAICFYGANICVADVAGLDGKACAQPRRLAPGRVEPGQIDRGEAQLLLGVAQERDDGRDGVGVAAQPGKKRRRALCCRSPCER